MSGLPTWVWYVGGVGIFILIYLYLQSRGGKTSNPIGQTVTVPSSTDLANQNGSADVLAAVLNMQSQEIQHFAAGNRHLSIADQPAITVSK